MNRLVYVLILLAVSVGFFLLVASIFETNQPYTDLVLTIIATQLVMAKTVNIIEK